MKSSDWISVKDRLPDLKVKNNFEKESDDVLLCLCGKEVVVGKLVVSNVASNHNTHRYWKSSMDGYAYLFNYVTHWQEIILPKKEKI